ncbi:MAG: hypothetical protein H7326_07645 [Bdellovibrionaceae bacterium]|nr:hypothetical protein [Pseudobdellovibrionaceae bacterium]
MRLVQVFYFIFSLMIAMGFEATAGPAESARACKLLATDYYSKSEKEEIQILCRLPARTQLRLPNQYWYRHSDYQKFIRSHPLTPQAIAMSDLDDARVSRILNHPKACQFYSMISPSVQSGRVVVRERVRIVMDAEDLLLQCQNFASSIRNGGVAACGVIELAGHSTQAVGLDGVLDFEVQNKDILKQLGSCFRKIVLPNGGVVTSTCGGERDSDGILHYWRGKAPAQQGLSDILGLPIISGIGPVRFASEFGANGAAAVGGWTLTYPRKVVR